MTPVANGKIFNQIIFNYFVWTPLDSRVSTRWGPTEAKGVTDKEFVESL
jgi:hypothetical protein